MTKLELTEKCKYVQNIGNTLSSLCDKYKPLGNDDIVLIRCHIQSCLNKLFSENSEMSQLNGLYSYMIENEDIVDEYSVVTIYVAKDSESYDNLQASQLLSLLGRLYQDTFNLRDYTECKDIIQWLYEQNDLSNYSSEVRQAKISRLIQLCKKISQIAKLVSQVRIGSENLKGIYKIIGDYIYIKDDANDLVCYNIREK